MISQNLMPRFIAVALVVTGLSAAVLQAHGSTAYAQTVAERTAGRILLSVEEHGEAWYVDPDIKNRVYMKDGPAAYAILEDYGLGIINADLDLIPVGLDDRFALTDSDGDGLFDALETGLGTDSQNVDSDGDGKTDKEEVVAGTNPNDSGVMAVDSSLVNRLKGRILLQVEKNGEAWYVNPADGKRYYMANGEAAYEVMRYLGLGITVADLQMIPVRDSQADGGGNDGGDNGEAGTLVSFYENRTVSTRNGSFSAKIVGLNRDHFVLKTGVAHGADCAGNCTATTLADYEDDYFGAQAAINGTYFCPPDYSDCASKTYTFLPPVLNQQTGVLVNEDLMRFHDRPMIAQTDSGELFYYHRGDDDFPESLAEFESMHGNASAVIGSWPSLIENGTTVLAGEPQEGGFNNYGLRGGIGWDDTYIYFVNISGARMDDLAAVFEALGADYAMNLDGGGSSALMYDGSYKVGPGRLLPNAIVGVRK